MNRMQMFETKEDSAMYESYIKKLNHDIEKIEQEECELMSKEEEDVYKRQACGKDQRWHH